MPKVVAYRLAWSSMTQAYTLYKSRDREPLRIVPESPEWFAWLDQVSSFAFSGKTGHYTARKELKRRGDWYWSAYRATGEKRTKKYLGKTTAVTLARLEQVAQLLSADRGADVHLVQEMPSQAGPTEAQAPTPVSLAAAAADVPGDKAQQTMLNQWRDPLNSLLATKLHMPRPRARLVPRSHLTERVQQGAAEYALTLISAPAGFGKTTLLVQWLAENSTPVAWLSLEPEDNEPVRFLAYVITALQAVDPRIGMTALTLLHTPQPASPETVLTVLTNDITSCDEGDFALVLDDYHVITAQPIQRAMTFLLEHLPPQMHLIIATRADPQLPLARLRAGGQLRELRAAELRFRTSEVSAFLQAVTGLDLPPEDIVALHNRTEGWVAGLQLAALSLQDRADVSGFLTAFPGSHHFVLDYLSEEVLSRQPALVQAFLLHTCILQHLSGPLCEAVTGQEEGQAMLETLDHANLFVVSLDDERQWYRYHHLFAEVLHSRLQQAEPALVPELHRRASAWYEQHGLIIEAVQHALTAPDFERAARLIEQFALPLGLRGHLYTVLGWLDALPDPLVCARPFLCICHAAMLISANQLQKALTRLQDAERCAQEGIPAEQAQIILGNVFSLRSTTVLLSGDLSRGTSIAQQALDLLPETEVIARAGALVTAAHSYLLSGDVTPATERKVETAVALARTSGNLFAVVRSLCLLAWLDMLKGRLHQASRIYEQVVQAVPRAEVLGALGISSLLYYFGLGTLQYERNSLDEAARHLALGLDMIKETLTVEPYVARLGYRTLARLRQARGDFPGALVALDAFIHLAHERHFAPDWVAQAAAVRAQLELTQSHLAAALRWVDESSLSTDDEDISYPREREYLTLVRVLIAQGRENPTSPFLQDALHLLDHLLQDAEAKARMDSVLEILVLRALALEAQRDRTRALSTLERALSLAESEGYIRLFVDEGVPMLTLLRHTLAHSIVPDYVSTLLAAFGEQKSSDSPPHDPRPSALVEPLTEREREVLRLLLEGASNHEIARRLILSVNTVKRHVYNICGKLGVQSRTQVVVRARALNLW